MDNKKPLTSKERKQLAKQRKTAAKQAQKYHKEQEKKSKTAKKSSSSSQKRPVSKIEQTVNEKRRQGYEEISREEKYKRESEQRIRNLKPHDFEDGYYIDEFSARQKQKQRVKEIHEQENEVIRRRKKHLTQKQIRRRRIFLYGGICVFIIAIGIILSLTVLFKTEKIQVEGNKYYYDDQIIGFSNVSYQQNIFLAVLGSTPEEITDNLPYIEEASVNFTIPDTITIKVKNATPTYVIKNGKNYIIVSAKGRILDIADNNNDKLPQLKCDKLKSTEKGDYVNFSDKNVPDILEQVSNSIKSNELSDITAFDITDTANIKLIYDDRITINIGLPEDIDYKIKTAKIIINEKLDPNNTGTISGTLDVSACNTTKISHYKPDETVQTTQPSTSATNATDADGQAATQNTEPSSSYSLTWNDIGATAGTESSESTTQAQSW